jgi:hypothetical protein
MEAGAKIAWVNIMGVTEEHADFRPDIHSAKFRI